MFHVLVPIAVAILPFALYAATGTDRALVGEMGIIENMTVLFLLVAISFAVRSLVHMGRRQDIPGVLRPWLVLMILGSVYFAGEELSWGQHIIGWNTSEYWSRVNDQGETNFHNTSFLLDQFPRTLLTIAVLLGGALAPIYRKFRGIELNRMRAWYWVLPTIECLPAASLVLLYRPIVFLLGVDFVPTGEVKETAIALFILVYLDSVRSRLRPLERTIHADVQVQSVGVHPSERPRR